MYSNMSMSLIVAVQEDFNEKQHDLLHFRKTSMKSSISFVVTFQEDINPKQHLLYLQEDRRKIPEGASLGLYREDGKEHRKPVYKQVEQSLCQEVLLNQFLKNLTSLESAAGQMCKSFL